MLKIGLISDTHGYLSPDILNALKEVNEIWHAGDIGGMNVVKALRNLGVPIRAVYGNIDTPEMRNEFSAHQRFKCEQVDVWMTHIGGYPGKYASQVKPRIYQHPPRLFISGHSHILKVMYDDRLDLLHINPGAAGKTGFHKVKTAVQLVIEGPEIKDLQVIEQK